jgi:hypothetical protein
VTIAFIGRFVVVFFSLDVASANEKSVELREWGDYLTYFDIFFYLSHTSYINRMGFSCAS